MAQKKQIQELPFKSIPEASKNYESGNIVVRMIEGLGYRYYWATEGLQAGDLDYTPSDSGQSTKETLKHIHGLADVLKNVSFNLPSIRPAPNQSEDFVELRKQTLNYLEEATVNFKNKTPKELAELKVIFERGGKQSSFPFWNMINGPLADAIYHTGQVVSYRRSSGNPLPKGVNVFMGKTKE
tara:strand:- start:224 stop:772 length:549 start_codon:yes stop_codon:yes gene_type:complete